MFQHVVTNNSTLHTFVFAHERGHGRRAYGIEWDEHGFRTMAPVYLGTRERASRGFENRRPIGMFSSASDLSSRLGPSQPGELGGGAKAVVSNAEALDWLSSGASN